VASVSVVIPCYRYGHFLHDCIGSALRDQPGVDVRVLVIDDASPDDSADVARSIAAEDSRVEVVVHAENRGHIATYNEGLLGWADGDYCALLSADDRLTPGALTRAAGLLDAHPEVGFVYGHPLHFEDGTPLPPARTEVKGWSVWESDWWLERRFREANGCITSPEVVVRTALQQKVGGYDAALTHTGDVEMWMRLASQAGVGYIRGVDQAYYRVHRSSMSKAVFGKFDDLVQRRAAYEKVLVECRANLRDPDHLDRIVHRKLARQALWRASRAYDRGRTDVVPVDELVAFAKDCWPAFEKLPEYKGLQIRQRIGPTVMPRLQPLVLSAVMNKGREWLWWQSWQRRGI
jgi:glycosyltransferase involved in cell wall biosynthesis